MVEQFCPLCEVSLDLHDGPDSCASAEAKADLLTAAFKPFLNASQR